MSDVGEGPARLPAGERRRRIVVVVVFIASLAAWAGAQTLARRAGGPTLDEARSRITEFANTAADAAGVDRSAIGPPRFIEAEDFERCGRADPDETDRYVVNVYREFKLPPDANADEVAKRIAVAWREDAPYVTFRRYDDAGPGVFAIQDSYVVSLSVYGRRVSFDVSSPCMPPGEGPDT